MKKIDKEKLSLALSSDKTRAVLIFICIGAVLLIFLSTMFTQKEDVNTYEELSPTEYCENLSSELVDMIENIEGAGEAQVLLTLESSYEYIYLDDDKTLTKIVEPKIRGVAVALKGGEDPVIKEKVTQMLTTVLSVGSGSISVSKLR